MSDLTLSLVDLSRALGDPSRGLAILAEGNASASTNADSFWVKASGRSMETLDASGLVEVRTQTIMDVFEQNLSDGEVRECLSSARVDGNSPLPSVETFMHAYLLGLPDISWVAHTHPIALLSLLSIDGAESRATQRLFPDEVVCCGPASAFVPYKDPGMPLARAIRDSVVAHVQARGELPKTIWLQNHGLIVIGRSPKEVLSGTLMSEKAARVWLGAMCTGVPLSPLSTESISRIHTRPDEHYRQALLWQVQRSSL